MKYFLPIFLLFTLLPFGLYSQTFQVKVIGISDGDTFTGLNSDNLQLKFRIHGIDAPEKKQAFGTKAREHLGSLIFGQNVTVDVNDQDRWGRYIATVATEDGKDVGKEMIQAGLAWHYKHYDNILNKDLKTSIRACSVICHDIRVEVLELAHLRKENGEIFKNLNKKYNG